MDWVTTFQASTPESLEHALERWSESAAETWFIASLSKVGRDHGQTAALLEAAAAVETGSAAWETATYHRVRLLLELGRREEAREALDAALTMAGTVPAAEVHRETGRTVRTRHPICRDSRRRWRQRRPRKVTLRG